MLSLREQVAIAAVAKCKATLEVALDTDLETGAGPIACNAFTAVDQRGYFAKCGSGTPAIQGNHGIAEPFRLSAPPVLAVGSNCGGRQQAVQPSKLPRRDGDIGTAADKDSEDPRRDNASSSRDRKLE